MQVSPLRAACCLAVVLISSLHAQQGVTFASLAGSVHDASGATVPNVLLSVKDTERNQERTVTADSEGRFLFHHLTAGSYMLRAQAEGFAVYERPLLIAAGQALDLPVTLGITQATETVDVMAEALSLETARSQVAEFVVTRDIDSLPLNGRNYLDLALLVPGVSRTNTGAPQQFAETSAVAGTGISFAGQRNLNNNFVLDGLSLNDDAADLAGTYVSQEVIREFQVVTSGGTAEFGRASAGVINVTSKSGTNDWHGRAYSFFRNQRLDARNPFATRKDPLTQAQYGASLGGPITQDRLFFFTNFEQTRRNAAGFVTIAPSNVAAINRVLATKPDFRGPQIQTGQYGTGYDTTNVFARADSLWNNSHQLGIRYSFYEIASPNARSVGALNDISRGTRLDNTDHSIAVNQVSMFSPRVMNELRGQLWRSRLSAPGNDLIGPAITISGVASFGASTTSPVGRDNNLFELSDGLCLIFGTHSLRLGGQFLYNRLDIYFPGTQLAANYTFASLADFSTGQYQTFQQGFGEPSQFQSNPNFGFFFQDEWKLRQKLVLHLGLRYDIQKMENPIRVDKDNLSPRLGFAWSPGDGKTVFRGNYGLFYDRIPLRAVSNALQRDGSKYRVALLAFNQPGAPVFPQQLTAFPPGQYINVTTIDSNIENSYSHQASFQIEREVTQGTFVSAGYQWLRGLHLILSRNRNVPTLTAAEANAAGIPNLGRPDPAFGNISYYEGSGDSYYNGLLVSVRSRLNRAADFRVSYTLSKAIDNVGNAFFSAPQNNANLRDDRGLSDNDQRHRLTVSAVLRWKGWQLSPMFRYTSALPYNVQLGFDRNNDTNTNDRPIGVARNTGRGFNYAALDTRVSRLFRLTERLGIEAIFEGFNVLNRTNYALVNNVFGRNPVPNASFGQPTAVFDPRQMQAALRVSF